MLSRHFRLYGAAVLLTIALMTLQARMGPMRPFAFVPSIFHSISGAIEASVTALGDTMRMLSFSEGQLRALEFENKSLREANAGYGELRRENERLRALVGFASTRTNAVAAARVVARGSDLWRRTFIINKGMSDGIKREMAVVVPEGLVGTVISVDNGFSTVLLVEDERFSAAVRLEDSRVEGVLRGSGSGFMNLEFVLTETPVKVGEAVVTSGLDAMFPKGIIAARVVSADAPEKELFQSIVLEPVVDISRVEEVVVLER